MQIQEIKQEDVLFLDIETAPIFDDITSNEDYFDSWKYKKQRDADEKGLDIVEMYKRDAGLYPEFSRIVCISIGLIESGRLMLKTFKGEESDILRDLMSFTSFNKKKRPLLNVGGYAVKTFDIPFIYKRCIVNQVKPVSIFDVGGLKPWEILSVDLKEIWNGSSTSKASLLNVCISLGLESPKSDISGKDVADVIKEEGGLDRVCRYCEKDVLSSVQVFNKLRFEKVITETVELEQAEDNGLIMRISIKGEITEDLRAEIMEAKKGLSYQEKEAFIRMIRGALAMSKQELDFSIELEILK